MGKLELAWMTRGKSLRNDDGCGAGDYSCGSREREEDNSPAPEDLIMMEGLGLKPVDI